MGSWKELSCGFYQKMGNARHKEGPFIAFSICLKFSYTNGEFYFHRSPLGIFLFEKLLWHASHCRGKLNSCLLDIHSTVTIRYLRIVNSIKSVTSLTIMFYLFCLCMVCVEACKLWLNDGKNCQYKTVSQPTIFNMMCQILCTKVIFSWSNVYLVPVLLNCADLIYTADKFTEI